MIIASWLESLGLGQYASAFDSNEIDAEMLPKLTAEDLKEIGVAALAHRKKILEAIAALDGDQHTSRSPLATDTIAHCNHQPRRARATPRDASSP